MYYGDDYIDEGDVIETLSLPNFMEDREWNEEE